MELEIERREISLYTYRVPHDEFLSSQPIFSRILIFSTFQFLFFPSLPLSRSHLRIRNSKPCISPQYLFIWLHRFYLWYTRASVKYTNFAVESLQKSISKPGNGFESRSNKYSARGLVVGRDGKKTKNKKQKTKKKSIWIISK